MDGQNIGWMLGLGGGLIGVLGGALGTWMGIRNTNGPRERAFMIRVAAACWVAVLAMLGLQIVLPPPWRYLLWIPYVIALSLGIPRLNRTQQRIRREETGKPS